ncbi:Phosphoadenosine phosphosulfate reductase CysH-type [Rhizopogon vinicolor AM-OR11-026]|uniref:Phosphoadenosine phosphosulfate reductase CysH-type n=1 Tax=Rhizopogon vinicolor AM-OR11-026 TaxID=1314800 RepID=A0A1B7N132_9AGAM|nr:Phosphoadenosine phosphosulfate reductase CysH-type [Rhizopogon vinicolor AM-OR11-026]
MVNVTTEQFSTPLELPLSTEILTAVNAHLSQLSPQDILAWALTHLPALYQTTAFGLTGLVALDMLSKSGKSIPKLIFLDTLYHFTETYELVQQVRERYAVDIKVYKPEGCETVVDFEKKHGEELWVRDEDIYDFAIKVEPAQRAYQELGVRSVITGRRKSQGGDRASLQPLEVDETGLLKLNPLFAWSFAQVETYIHENNVPRNALLDQGYRSVGDWHSTQPSHEGDTGERAGRWANKEEKTECGLHKNFYEMKAKAKLEEEHARAEEAKTASEMATAA